jgi:hypothetical protein
VRVEIETALSSNIPIVPILVGGARMPSAAELPESIRKLSFINAATVDSGRDFNFHIARLTRQLDDILASRGKSRHIALQRTGQVKLSRVQVSLIAALVGASLILPFAGTWAQTSPPWPRGIAPLTSVFGLGAIVFAFQLLRSSHAAAIHRFWLVGSFALVLTFASYLALFSRFTYEIPSTGELRAKGFVCTPEALLVYKGKCPDLGSDELRDAEYESERLWTTGSLTTVKIALVMLWILGFVALGSLTGSLVAQQRLQSLERGIPFAKLLLGDD